MERIKIGETIHEAELTHAGDMLGLAFDGPSIEQVASLLAGAGEVCVLSLSGAQKAVYKNHALTRVYGETAAGRTRVHAVLKTQLIEQKEAEEIRDEIAKAKAEADKIKDEIAQAKAEAEKIKNEITLAKTEREKLSERIAIARAELTVLREESELLTGCLLEMSETVYA